METHDGGRHMDLDYASTINAHDVSFFDEATKMPLKWREHLKKYSTLWQEQYDKISDKRAKRMTRREKQSFVINHKSVSDVVA